MKFRSELFFWIKRCEISSNFGLFPGQKVALESENRDYFENFGRAASGNAKFHRS